MKRMSRRYVIDIAMEALLALKDNRLRTILSILGIAVGIAAVMTVGAVSKGGHFFIFSELQTFGLKSVWVFRDYADKDPHRSIRAGTGIDNADYTTIRDAGCSAVHLLSPIVRARSRKLLIRFGNRYASGQLLGVGVDYIGINNDTLLYGRKFRSEDITHNHQVVIIGTEVVDDLFGAQTNPIGRDIRIGDKKFTILGVLAPKNRDFLASIGSAGGQNANNRLLLPYPLFQEMINFKEIPVLQAEATTFAQANTAVSQIEGILKHRHGDRYTYKSETMSQYIKTTDNILKWVTFIGVVAASVSLFVGGMGIMNIMSTSVLERTREIGIRKALGASRLDVLLQFVFEAILISSVGGILGLIFGILIGYAMGIFASIPLAPSWPAVMVSMLVSIGVGLFSGYYPALRAANLHPVEALRFE